MRRRDQWNTHVFAARLGFRAACSQHVAPKFPVAPLIEGMADIVRLRLTAITLPLLSGLEEYDRKLGGLTRW